MVRRLSIANSKCSMKLKNPILITVLSLLLLTSCGLLEFKREMVVTTSDNVVMGTPKEDIFVIPVDWIKPEVQDQLAAADKSLVIVPKEDLLDPAKPAVELETKIGDKEAVLSAAEIGIDIAKVFFPGLAALEGLGYIFSQRKRSNYNAAVKAILPINGSVDVSDAIKSVAKALGFAHTVSAPKPSQPLNG